MHRALAITGRRARSVVGMPLALALPLPIPLSLPLSSSFDPTVGDLELIAATALRKDPERRYQSAGDLARDVGRLLDDEPIEARPSSVVYQVRMFSRRHRALVVSAVSIVLVLFGAVVSMGLILRATLPPWLAALEQLKADPESEQAQSRVETIYRYSGRWAHSLWTFVVLMGLLGTVKPF